MKYILKIPKPCHEQWDTMTPTEKGAFCAKCDKEVLDFTNTSQEIIAQRIQEGKNICGKFKPHQLNTIIQTLPLERNFKIAPYLGFVSLLALSTPAISQTTEVKIEKISHNAYLNDFKQKQLKANDSLQFTGHVKDKYGNLPGVTIVLKGSKIGTQTDFDGNFTLNIAQEDLKKSNRLVFQFIGMNSKEINISPNMKPMNVVLESSSELMGEVIIVPYNTKKKN